MFSNEQNNAIKSQKIIIYYEICSRNWLLKTETVLFIQVIVIYIELFNSGDGERAASQNILY